MHPATEAYLKHMQKNATKRQKKAMKKAMEKALAAKKAVSEGKTADTKPAKVSPKFPRYEFHEKCRADNDAEKRAARERHQEEQYPFLVSYAHWRRGEKGRVHSFETTSRLNQFFYFVSDGKGVRAKDVVPMLLSQDFRARWYAVRNLL